MWNRVRDCICPTFVSSEESPEQEPYRLTKARSKIAGVNGVLIQEEWAEVSMTAFAPLQI
jgi:hypothetical protein